VLDSDNSIGVNGTINYTTGAWAIPSTVGVGIMTSRYGCTTEGGGYLYVDNIPSGCTGFTVIGAKRIFDTDDIQDQFIVDFLLGYSKALCRIAEGNVLRKSSIIDITNDGQQNIDEGKEELEKWKQDLFDNGRWMSFARRM